MSRGVPAGSPVQGGQPHATRQWSYFKDADAAHFHWQTSASAFAATERDLVSRAIGGGRLLEVGCGEGGNLFHFGPREDPTVGLDYSRAKVDFASTAVPWARFVCGDAVRLPFRSGVFDRVFCRDLFHHLRDSEQRDAVGEMARVCRPGGEVVVIEPNGRNPLIGAFALLVPAERGMLRSTPARLAKLLGGAASWVSLDMAQPLPLARVLFHYRIGLPGLGDWRPIARLLSGIDGVLRRLMPRSLWAYITVRGEVPLSSSGGKG